MNHDDLTEIKITLARIETQLAADRLAAEAGRSNLKLAIDTFVPRREIESQASAFGARLEKIEEMVTWAIRGLIGSYIAGGGVVLALIAKKFGIGP